MTPPAPTRSTVAAEIVITYASEPSAKAAETRLALQQAVSEALERKARLGQYAVFWEAGAVVRVEPADLPIKR